MPPLDVTSATQRVDAALLRFLRELKVGDRIRIVQRVRVGSRMWAASVDGAFRDLNYLATGLATQRVPDDDIVVPTLHFVKDNGELASVSLDEHSKVSKI